ncbi:L,D-transpeptidase [Nocardioides sp. Leaf285]|uniref:L,D-transpeptidase n=1 Tax=Nocardioides sp. Leaf285 TaxID=1736322 RepID=UPI0007037792|nr:L,D-transpeptidase [Nocardioides sp. Leaf285]KQP64455.1 hypothetical protein ASF47_10820 [Nocardioides sp. Leaf285]
MTGRRTGSGQGGPRYGRLAALGSSLLVTAVAVLGGTGVLPSSAEEEEAPVVALESAPPRAGAEPEPEDPAVAGAPAAAWGEGAAPLRRAMDTLPARSGSGRRVVFSESRQRVWLVEGSGAVASTYLVSGSLTDNLDPGTYEVWSRSLDAIGIDDSGTMRYFVRFTRGPSGAAIGFHDIPVDDGERVQSRLDLGTPRSHGCIRQQRSDARLMWAFAPLGTEVVVTA